MKAAFTRQPQEETGIVALDFLRAADLATHRLSAFSPIQPDLATKDIRCVWTIFAAAGPEPSISPAMVHAAHEHLNSPPMKVIAKEFKAPEGRLLLDKSSVLLERHAEDAIGDCRFQAGVRVMSEKTRIACCKIAGGTVHINNAASIHNGLSISAAQEGLASVFEAVQIWSGRRFEEMTESLCEWTASFFEVVAAIDIGAIAQLNTALASTYYHAMQAVMVGDAGFSLPSALVGLRANLRQCSSRFGSEDGLCDLARKFRQFVNVAVSKSTGNLSYLVATSDKIGCIIDTNVRCRTLLRCFVQELEFLSSVPCPSDAQAAVNEFKACINTNVSQNTFLERAYRLQSARATLESIGIEFGRYHNLPAGSSISLHDGAAICENVVPSTNVTDLENLVQSCIAFPLCDCVRDLAAGSLQLVVDGACCMAALSALCIPAGVSAEGDPTSTDLLALVDMSALEISGVVTHAAATFSKQEFPAGAGVPDMPCQTMVSLFSKMTISYADCDVVPVTLDHIVQKPIDNLTKATLLNVLELAGGLHKISVAVASLRSYVLKPSLCQANNSFHPDFVAIVVALTQSCIMLKRDMQSDKHGDAMHTANFLFQAPHVSEWLDRCSDVCGKIKTWSLKQLVVNDIGNLAGTVSDLTHKLKTEHLVNDNIFLKGQCKKELLNGDSRQILGARASELHVALFNLSKCYANFWDGPKVEDEFEEVLSYNLVLEKAKQTLTIIAYVQVILSHSGNTQYESAKQLKEKNPPGVPATLVTALQAILDSTKEPPAKKGKNK